MEEAPITPDEDQVRANLHRPLTDFAQALTRRMVTTQSDRIGLARIWGQDVDDAA